MSYVCANDSFPLWFATRWAVRRVLYTHGLLFAGMWILICTNYFRNMKTLTMHSRGLFLLLVAMALFFFSGCSASIKLSSGPNVSGTEYYSSLYVGQTHANIVKEFGAPSREVSDGEGGYILVYETYSSSSRAYMDGYMDNTLHRSFIEFYMDSGGVCQSIRTNKLSPGETKEILTAAGLCWGVMSGISTLGIIAVVASTFFR